MKKLPHKRHYQHKDFQLLEQRLIREIEIFDLTTRVVNV